MVFGTFVEYICFIPIYIASFFGAIFVICGISRVPCYRFRNSESVKEILLLFGYDKHADEFLIASIRAGKNFPEDQKVSFTFRCIISGEPRNAFETANSDLKEARWEESLTIGVEQGTTEIEVCLLHSQTVIAKTKASMDTIREHAQRPDSSEPLQFKLQRVKGNWLHANPKVTVKFAFAENENTSLLVHRVDSSCSSQNMDSGLKELSFNCCGWLGKTSKFGLTQLRYFQMLLIKREWYWTWSGSKKDSHFSNHQMQKFILVSRITSVSKLPDNPTVFSMRHRGNNGHEETLVLKCDVDGGRHLDVWVEAIIHFLSRYRDVRKVGKQRWSQWRKATNVIRTTQRLSAGFRKSDNEETLPDEKKSNKSVASNRASTFDRFDESDLEASHKTR